MGFGFNFFCIFILLPLTVLLLVLWAFTQKAFFGRTLFLLWLAVAALVFVSLTLQWLASPTVLSKEDYYGSYIVDRSYFPGKQSDWQYNHFRFEINEDDTIYFYETDNDKIVKTYVGHVATSPQAAYNSARLIVKMFQPTHHIVSSDPTTYRDAWDFIVVFNSPKFNNVFFKKGKWKPIKSTY
ncbi:MAG: hypothetical protein RL660_592 [Bacteroidota bacterium]|jgi:hypothetical protein